MSSVFGQLVCLLTGVFLQVRLNLKSPMAWWQGIRSNYFHKGNKWYVLEDIMDYVAYSVESLGLVGEAFEFVVGCAVLNKN